MQLVVPILTDNKLNNNGWNAQLTEIDRTIMHIAEAQYRNDVYGFREPVDFEVYELLCEKREILLDKFMGCDCLNNCNC